MLSWEIMRHRDQWGLFIRDYYAQGNRPDYHLFKKINEAMAIKLVQDELAGDLYGDIKKLINKGD